MKLKIKISLLVLLIVFIPSRTLYNFNKVVAYDFNGSIAEIKAIILDNYSSNEELNLRSGLKYKTFAHEITKSDDFDWRLILAIIKQESQFDPNAVSSQGAQGLMQLHPSTQADFGLDSNEVFVPYRNIEVGIKYFKQLYNLFVGADRDDRIRLALAAYNAGPSRIYDAQELAAYLGENPLSWRAIQNALPLLSKRFQTLHRSIWDGGKPRNGYFGGWRQTLYYVDKVLAICNSFVK